MSTTALMAELRGAGAVLWEEDGRLRYRAPKGVLTPNRLDALRAGKEEVLALLRAEQRPVALVPDPDAAHEPFPLTDVQTAYLLGRNDAFGHGGVACHACLEVAYPDLDPERTEAAWNRLVERHAMLRAVAEADGYQRVLPAVPHLDVPCVDLREADAAHVERELAAVREELGHKIHPADRWPLYELRVTRCPDRALLHLSLDFLTADWASIRLLLSEFEALHADPEHELPPLTAGFRDYLLAERQLREGPRYQRDRAYWWSRLDELPPAPELPLAAGESAPRFTRRQLRLDRSAWQRLKQQAQLRDLTPSAAVLAAYAAAIERWSRTPRFSLNLTVLNRQPLHPETDRIVGDFTSVNALAVDWTRGRSFAQRAAALGERLFEDLDHRLCSGVEVLRELARRRGRAQALLPIVFTSAIGLGEPTGTGRLDGFGITQTPQVFVDCQAMDDADGLLVNWDARDGVFPDGLLDDMFAAFEALLHDLADGPQAWEAAEPVPLPSWQAEERRRANDTAAELPDTLLHQPFFAQAARTPERPAVLGPAGTLSYRQLAARATAVARALRAAGCTPGAHVAVVMDKGPEQVAAVLGTLLAGAVYLPIDTTQPPLRRAAIREDAGAHLVLTQSWLEPEGTAIAVDLLADAEPGSLDPGSLDPGRPEPGDPDAPAYLIYTSGSTGKPKGVLVSHRAAGNTIADINRRFAVGAEDRVLALAQLGFDLSVYDVFGPLSAGGALVLPAADRRTDPSHWAELIAEHRVSLWNSVPALMHLLGGYLAGEPAIGLPSLRLALLSGDWIPLTLPDEITGRLPGLRVIGLGGATEAAIWSIHHPYQGLEPGWRSIPYGRPLANQGWRVLDAHGRDCPVWAVGELYISGAGLAQGYFGDPDTTGFRFVDHPDGQHLYRTGDFGRYLPGGEIEFLGREDTQVKLRGHRIELGEIEAALLDHPAVAAAGVVLDGTDADRALLAVVEPARTSPAPFAPPVLDEPAEGPTRSQVEIYVERLDAAVLASMAHALDELTRTGATVDPRHTWLVGRWWALLGDRTRATAAEVQRAWAELDAAWTPELGSPEFLAYLRRNAERLPQLLTGTQNPVELLFPEGGFDTARALYREHSMARYLNTAVASLLGQLAAGAARPLRVLEVGAGTGGTTEGVLAALDSARPDGQRPDGQRSDGERPDYLFTDVSPFFLPEARTRFGDRPWVRFGVFDVDQDHRAQGLAPNSFDVVLAAGVLENARDTAAALARLADLVAPGGWLVLTEPTREHPWILASQAFMMQRPQDERRSAGASYLDRAEWLELLARSAGAERVLCLPADDHPLAPQGVHLFAARLKTDRVPVTEAELLAHLSERLPGHMLPGHLQLVDALPLSGNGKVDRRTLAGWRPARTEAARTARTDDLADPFEARLAALWAQALAVPQVGRTEDFYSLGADSLITARMTGRLRAEVPEAAAVPFDSLLRRLLNHPTVAALAEFLRAFDGAPDSVPDDSGRRAEGSNAVLVPLGPASEGPVRVLFHAGLGTMDCFRPLAAQLAAQRLGPVLGIVIDDPEVYTAQPPAGVVERLADDYTARLLAEGHTRFQLVGYCLGGLFAAEVARRLDERGATVEDLALISSHPVVIDVEDDLMIELLFVPNLHISLQQAGFGEVAADELLRAFLQVLERHGGRVPEGELAKVGGDPGLDAVAGFVGRLGAVGREERFERYARAASEASGQHMPAEMVAGMFRVYRQSFLAARFTPEPYAGDIRFLRPTASSGFAPGMDESTLAFWREVGIGELAVAEIEGNHFSCIEESNARAVAELLAEGITR
ncbi:non-ribosomal peptide synthetase [Kitasatospora viridis]|uniref:Phenyloxazoline synthase MbtB n=1 Tax=Kitasatospora viridis TaxID=281105 RepID=A0A561T626_9ACTN|nr:non-ribosomal peptide synthetase [Kitasatospora viridis]TWF82561.1 pyochelin synthetase [Kitasatospora viridis]